MLMTCSQKKVVRRAGLSTRLTRLQPRAPEFLGAPIHAVIVTER